MELLPLKLGDGLLRSTTFHSLVNRHLVEGSNCQGALVHPRELPSNTTPRPMHTALGGLWGEPKDVVDHGAKGCGYGDGYAAMTNTSHVGVGSEQHLSIPQMGGQSPLP